MHLINNMRTIAKMICAFALVIVISVIVNALSWSSLSFQQTANGWTVHTYEVLQGVDDIVSAMVDRETGVRGYLLAGDEGFLAPYNAGSENYEKAFNEVVRLTSDNATQQKRLSELAALVKGWTEEVAAKEIALMKDPATVEQARAMEINGAGKKWMDGIRAKAAEIAGDEASLLTQRATAAVEAADSARMTILKGAAVMIASVIGLLVLLQKSLVAPLVRIAGSMRVLADGDTSIGVPGVGRTDEVGQMAAAVEVFRQNAIANRKLEEEAVAARGQTEETRLANQRRIQEEAEKLRFATETLGNGLQRLAEGDISFQLTEAFAEDYEPLRRNFNASLQQLAMTIGSVLDSVTSMDSGTREISAGATDLSKRTEQQAAALEETAAALDEITVNVRNSSQRTDEARSVAVLANENAARSAQVVSQAVEAMRRIEDSSQQISNIIGVIDEIAFQTNLLALNAGVEAARAGEAGKGFAVVAQEVRELAQRSAQAAKEIKALITASGTQVSSGVALVGETGTALKAIGDYVVQINTLMDAIAGSAREQSTGLAEVNSAVNQMDQTTQQNAAMVEQSTAASAALAQEATRLRSLVAQFKLAGAPSESRQVASRAAADQTRRAPAAVSGNLALKHDWNEF
ncbi:methyl-accepting chemotaxis protein [Rhizobium wuzhouense]|uniref:Methyl-accepting chemotaxis protein n=1 Tax=Rhizobium wuzhouense TaxID=1986026 RepID=A0ABX5NXZ8_9HYPH|nr:methyl-accepting chemotaxis protein [Rhizobium wuzhouense]PYB77232.1 methyl-accepting chemotaxis protein [Rhizobium wuzhouense]